MNGTDETTEDQNQENQTSVTDANAQTGDESVTDANAQQSSQDSNDSGDQENSGASASTDTGSQSDDSTDSSDVANAETKELQAIKDRGEEQRKRLANRLAQQGRERVATERELDVERQKRENLEAENRRLRAQQSSNGQSDTEDKDTGGTDDADDADIGANTGADPRVSQLEAENRALRKQFTDAEAEEGGFYEDLSDDPNTAQAQMTHNMKVMREALIAQGDAEQNRQEREVHRQFVTAYTEQGIDQETAEQLVALDIEALEAESVSDKLKIQQDGKKLYADVMSKSTVRKQRQDDARKQQLQDRAAVAGTNGGGQGASVAGDTPPVESELKNMESMNYDQMMDHIEQLEEAHGADFVESILQRI